MTTLSPRILVVDDEPAIRKLLRVSLATQGFDIVDAATAKEARAALRDQPADLIILDLGLPDESGLDLLRQWRGDGITTPIVILSSRAEEADIVDALERGADDYVTKPFGSMELVARIRVALRHRLQTEGETAVFKAGDLSIDLVRRIVRVRETEVRLTPREYDILRELARHAGKVLTHAHLIRAVWGGRADVQNLRVHVRQLRQKIERQADQPQHILTETGIGYRFV